MQCSLHIIIIAVFLISFFVLRVFIVTQLHSTSSWVELSWQSVYSDADATQLNSTSSCRHVHSVNSCHLSMNVVTQLTQFVGRDVINKNTTDLAVRCSTRCRVELCRYKHPFRITSYLQTLCSQIGMSVLYSFCLLFCVHDYFKSNVSIWLKPDVMVEPTNRKNCLTFVGDQVADTDSRSLFHFHYHSRTGLLGDLLDLFLMQSPADFCRAMRCISMAYVGMQSVRLSVCHVRGSCQNE